MPEIKLKARPGITAEVAFAYVEQHRLEIQRREYQRLAFNENIQHETTAPGKGVTDIDALMAMLMDMSANAAVVPSVTFEVVAAYQQEEDDNDTEHTPTWYPDRHTLIPNVRLYPQKAKVTTSATPDGPSCHAYVPLVFSSAETEAEFSNILALGSLCQLVGITQQDLRVLTRSDRHTKILTNAIKAAYKWEHRVHAEAEEARAREDAADVLRSHGFDDLDEDEFADEDE